MRKKEIAAALIGTAILSVSVIVGYSQNTGNKLDETSSISVSGNDIDSPGKASESETADISISSNDVDKAEKKETIPESTETGSEHEASSEEESGGESVESTGEDNETDKETQDTTEAQKPKYTTENEETGDIKSPTQPSATEKSETEYVTPTTSEPIQETTEVQVTVKSITASVTGTYYIGDTLTAGDFKVTANMSDGTKVSNLTGFSAYPLNLTAATNYITVTYKDKETTVKVEAKERPVESQPESTSEETTADPHEGMVLADDGQWHETKAAGEELQAGDVICIDGVWHVLSPDYGKEKEMLIADGDYSYEMARMYFEVENEVRVEAGSSTMIWSDELYEMAKKCAKACGDAGRIDHDLTYQYCKYTYVDRDGDTITKDLPENLLLGSAIIYNEDDMAWEVEEGMKAIINSPGHYKTLIADNGSLFYVEGAVAVYRKGTSLYVSFLFNHVTNY